MQIVINIKTVASFPFFETSIGFFDNRTYIPPKSTSNSLAIKVRKKIFGKISRSQITNRINTVLSTKGSRIMPSSLTILKRLATIPSKESLKPITAIPVPDPKYTREKYNIDFTELDKIIADNTENLPMVDVGDEHYVATHDVKDLLI